MPSNTSVSLAIVESSSEKSSTRLRGQIQQGGIECLDVDVYFVGCLYSFSSCLLIFSRHAYGLYLVCDSDRI